MNDQLSTSSSSRLLMHFAKVIRSYLLSFSIICRMLLKWSSSFSAYLPPSMPVSSKTFIIIPANFTSPSNPYPTAV